MRFDLKKLACAGATVAMFATGSALAAEKSGARGEVYPNKPGHLILPFGPGGSTDVVARIFAQRFSEIWGQPLVVDNRAGAGGIVGTEIGARAPTDGHTIFTYGINQAITAGLYSKLPYDHLRDFTLISLYATMPNILCVTPSGGGAAGRGLVNIPNTKTPPKN
jgi:tripartite-type tricarboxylate transporter receptor subunit TctC